MDIFDWANLSIDKRHLVDELITDFRIPEKDIALIFDENDYANYPNPLWRNQGLHINMKLGGIEEWSPEPILNIMKSNRFSNLIWISNRICIRNLTAFVWVVSHEFQHFVQDEKCHILSVANSFLFNNLSHPSINIEEPKEALTVPYEFDAEINAYKAVKKLLGSEQAEKFINDPTNKLERLQNYDFSKSYNVIAETVYFFEKYQDELIKYIDSINDSFDIKKAISDLNQCYVSSN